MRHSSRLLGSCHRPTVMMLFLRTWQSYRVGQATWLQDRTSDEPEGGRVAPRAEPNIEVWTNLANALALQATDRSRPTASPAKKGFDALPATTQRMILVALEREEDEHMRSRPVESYAEILGLGNAAHVGQHLHHHLHCSLALDVWLPTGFCLASRLAAFMHLRYQGQAGRIQPVLVWPPAYQGVDNNHLHYTVPCNH